MRTACLQAINVMERAFRRLERQVPPPSEQPWKDGFVVRYQERTIEQALVQKLARQISGLWAVDALLLRGLAQEQGVIQRTLDEIGEDILFLALAITTNHLSPLHREYLSYFWAEEFDHYDPLKSTQNRGMVQRRKIRAYNARAHQSGDSSTVDTVGRTIHKAYSGYVHAASPHVMDMVWGSPPRFMLSGLTGTDRMDDLISDGWNYFYRGLLNVTIVAKAFGDKHLVEEMYTYIHKFEKASGTEYFSGSLRAVGSG